MLKNLKKMLILIPCMIFGLFLLSNSSVSAFDWELVGADSVVIGEGTSNETKYYFTDNTSWNFKTNLTVKDYAKYTFLTYVIVDPNGNATEESGKINFVNAKGAFSINDITSKEFNNTVDVSQRISIVPAGTYYVDITYYAGVYDFIKLWELGTDTIRIVVADGSENCIPNTTVTFNDSTNQFTIESSILKDGKGYSLIKDVEYYFSETDIQNEIKNFRTNMQASNSADQLSFKSSTVKVDIEKPSEEYNYLYVMVTTYNGYSKIVAFDMTEDVTEPGNGGDNKTPTNNQNPNDGLWDFEFGELILLVLVVVLIVSCVLIITQKIVDYKKRLY